MSGDRPTLPESGRPVSGTAAGTAYLALPPTAVDARPAGPTRLVLAWPGFDPPRTATALATAVPLTGVPTWRVYLDLPTPEGVPAGGLDSAALLDGPGVAAYAAAVERAVDDLPAVLADLRRDLDLEEGPVGLAGFSAGASVALLAMARGAVPVTAAALVTPVLSPDRSATSLERVAGRQRDWDAATERLAERLDLSARAGEVAAQGTAVLLIAGAHDRVVEPTEITDLRDSLRTHGAGAVEAATFRMEHALAAAPGIEAQPPTIEAVRVDGVLNDWFRERLAEVDEPEITFSGVRALPPGPPPASPAPALPAAPAASAEDPAAGQAPGAALGLPVGEVDHGLPGPVRSPMGAPPAADLPHGGTGTAGPSQAQPPATSSPEGPSQGGKHRATYGPMPYPWSSALEAASGGMGCLN
ncbi:alpha/beta hydrolase [Actinomadura viridis]|uniref:alpha/beta hydrolase n=1 Tax=Actinomadura viridis TaxID=58110 RepID=UPI00368BFD14